MRTLRGLWSCLAISCLLLSAPIAGQGQSASAAKTATQAQNKKGGKTTPAAAVDLNRATQEELQSVPGIGAATAKKIIAGRPYSSVNDLSKSGLSAKQIQGISLMVTVGSTPASSSAAPPPSKAPAPSATKTPTSITAASRPPATAAPAPGGGAGMVWVNPETKVFHRQGDRWYGKTKNGKYMTEAEATQAGYRESKEKVKP